MVTRKKEHEIELLRQGGALLSQTLIRVSQAVVPGVNMRDLNALAERLLREGGGAPAFLGYGKRGDTPAYPATLCVSVNNEVVHGIGTRNILLQEGDIVGLDIGVKYPKKKGLFTDMAMTVGVGKISSEKKRLIDVTRASLEQTIELIRPGCSTLDLSKSIQKTCESAGFSVARDLTGHGVGYEVHEDPPIFCYYQRGMPETILEEGMVICIEPMVCAGDWRVTVDPDGWTIRTADRKPSAHFEHTIAVTKNGHEVLTRFELPSIDADI